MKDEAKSKAELIRELREARRQLDELEQRGATATDSSGGSGRLAAQLAETANQLTNIMNTTPDLVFVKDLQLRTVLCNEAFAAAVGKTPAEVIGKTDIENGWDPDLVHGNPEKGIRGFENDDKLALSGEHVHNPRDPANVGDEVRYFDTHKIPFRDEKGEITGVLGVARDVTESKIADDERRAALDRLTATLNALPDMMFDIDIEGRIYDYRAPDPTSLAVPPDRFLDKFVADVLPGEAGSVIMRAIDQADQHGVHHGSTYPLEVGDELRWYELSIAARGEAGPGARFVALVRDITERKRAEEGLIEADRRKDEFLAVLGHELRNPLAPIRNAAHVLARQDELPDTFRRAVETIARQSEHLGRLVDDLLDVARITRGRIQMQPAPTAIQETVASALQVVGPVMEARQQNLESRVAEDTLMVQADPVRLAQVLTNLLDNAAKYTQRGGRIEIDVDRRGSNAEIWVRDNGAGVSPEDLPHLFEPFFRAAPERGDGSNAGLGLGLPLAAQLMRAMGGEIICVSSRPGDGTEFKVTVPLASEPTQVPTQQNKQTAAAETTARRRVLVVDDNPDVSDSFRMLLEAMGHQAKTLNDGREVLDAVRQWQPNVVFLDIAMPEMDGYQVAAAILEADLTARPLLVALTGFGEESHGDAIVEAGFDHHLLKPADPEQIERLLALTPTTR